MTPVHPGVIFLYCRCLLLKAFYKDLSDFYVKTK